ncbi:3-ketoacyl-CoA synthase 21-like [Pyrus ussuriensis x Pyrus communis]|uniref:3-ketoacyl-CoA synthase n=1 Tax=Pyrus ussuriensis x Pyrus communis TaxID=2448454 RepID=A0A5N5F1L2_9ROSA|nr:3-ketoacyl-CoA synthase 21-like [Pyrus ussuriensis x Pyrus communis]
MELLLATCLLLLVCAFIYLCELVLQWRHQQCYLLAYECYKATDDRKLDTESCRFLLKTIVNSGLGEETYGPRNVIAGREDCPSLKDSLWEMDDIMFGTLDKLFDKAGISTSNIDILVVNVSLFSPAPSLTARIINRYKMKTVIKAFNLTGMRCSGSLVAIDLVQNLFKTYKNVNAVVVSTELLAPNWYRGKVQPMMFANCLYRSGGCSMILTNKKHLEHRSLLKLQCIVRTHLGSMDEGYGCSTQAEDNNGIRGFNLGKSIAKVAAKALTMNLRILLQKVLPLTELLRYVIVSRRQNKVGNAGLNLKAGLDHFCIPPLLKPQLSMGLHRFGNTSSGGLWYVLGYMEAKKRLKKGEKILMVSFGAGYECNNCVWEIWRDMENPNVWKDCIESYPPETLVNPFMEKYSWINDEHLSFVRFEEVVNAICVDGQPSKNLGQRFRERYS